MASNGSRRATCRPPPPATSFKKPTARQLRVVRSEKASKELSVVEQLCQLLSVIGVTLQSSARPALAILAPLTAVWRPRVGRAERALSADRPVDDERAITDDETVHALVLKPCAGDSENVARRDRAHVPNPRGLVLRRRDDPFAVSLKAAEVRAPACPFKISISRRLTGPIRAVRSADAVRIRAPSALKDAAVTGSSWPLRIATSCPSDASQIRAVLSHDAVTIHLPSGLNAADVTTSPCPASIAIGRKVAASQIGAVLSCEAVTMREPSGLKAQTPTGPTCPFRLARSRAGSPHPRRAPSHRVTR